jgi:hypothetical protein
VRYDVPISFNAPSISVLVQCLTVSSQYPPKPRSQELCVVQSPTSVTPGILDESCLNEHGQILPLRLSKELNIESVETLESGEYLPAICQRVRCGSWCPSFHDEDKPKENWLTSEHLQNLGSIRIGWGMWLGCGRDAAEGEVS